MSGISAQGVILNLLLLGVIDNFGPALDQFLSEFQKYSGIQNMLPHAEILKKIAKKKAIVKI